MKPPLTYLVLLAALEQLEDQAIPIGCYSLRVTLLHVTSRPEHQTVITMKQI